MANISALHADATGETTASTNVAPVESQRAKQSVADSSEKSSKRHQRTCRCARYTFPHRWQTKCEQFESADAWSRALEAADHGKTIRSWEDKAADDAGVPRFGPI